jgi:hypothetical protein
MHQGLPLPGRDRCISAAQRLAVDVAASALALVLAVLICAPPAAAQSTQQYLYVQTTSSSSAPTIDAFAKNASTGALTAVPGSPFLERIGGGPMAVDVMGRYLFVANASANNISMFQIDSGTGALAEVPNSPFATSFPPPSGPSNTTVPSGLVGLAVEPSGQFLYAAFATGETPQNLQTGAGGGGGLEVFAISASGPALVPNSSLALDTPTGTPKRIVSNVRTGALYVPLQATSRC